MYEEISKNWEINAEKQLPLELNEKVGCKKMKCDKWTYFYLRNKMAIL